MQDLNEPRSADDRIVGDQRQIKVPGGGGNQAVVQFGDIVDLGGRFENFETERFELIVLALHQVLGLQQAYFDAVFFEKVHHFHQDNGRDNDGGFAFVGRQVSLVGGIVDYLFAHHEFYQALGIGHIITHRQTLARGAARFAF